MSAPPNWIWDLFEKIPDPRTPGKFLSSSNRAHRKCKCCGATKVSTSVAWGNLHNASGMLNFCWSVAAASDATRLDLSLLRDEPASGEALASSIEDGADDEPAEETSEEVGANLSKCYDAERNPDADERAQEGFNPAPSDDLLDADLYYDTMHGVWDGNLSALLVNEVEKPPEHERMANAALEAFLAMVSK